jgi:HPt (histidine-containing phosphotransfer) domain-containing protein
MPDQPAVDTTVLEELSSSVEGDTGFVRSLIDAYVADSAGLVDTIEAAVTAGDAAALVRPAHTLKSSSATVGASRLSATARVLEIGAREERLADADVRDAAARVRGEWNAAVDGLRAWIEASTSP